jgi:hypothetical protein
MTEEFEPVTLQGDASQSGRHLCTALYVIGVSLVRESIVHGPARRRQLPGTQGGWTMRSQAAIDSEGFSFSMRVEREGGSHSISVGWRVVSGCLREAIKDRQIKPGWLKIGLGTSKCLPYFTSA